MTIIDRYIFKELLIPFMVSLGALCFVVLTKEMLRLVELLIAKGIGFFSVLKVIAHLMPSFLVLTLPMACLISSITAFSQLSYEKELVAMRAAGISLLRISVPVVVFSLMVFGLTLYLSQWGQPWSNLNLKKLAITLIQDRLSLALEHGVFNEPVKGMMVYVPEPVDGKKPQGIFISDQRDPTKPFIVTAKNFHLLNDPHGTHLGIRLHDGIIHHTPRDITQHHQVTFNTYDVKMDLSSTLIREQKRIPYHEIMKRLEKTGWRNSTALRRLTEHYKDLAFPVATIILGILGLPVGIVTKRSGRMGGFTIGIAIMVGYYLLNVLGDFSVTTLILHPFMGAWLPNIILVILTGSLFYRVSLR